MKITLLEGTDFAVDHKQGVITFYCPPSRNARTIIDYTPSSQKDVRAEIHLPFLPAIWWLLRRRAKACVRFIAAWRKSH